MKNVQNQIISANTHFLDIGLSFVFLCFVGLDRIGRLLVRTLLRTVRVRFQTYGSSRTLSESSVMIFHRFMK